MTSTTFMTLNTYSTQTSATTMSTFGINYFDTCSSSECSDGYQSSISPPIVSPAFGQFIEKHSISYNEGYNYYKNQHSNYQPDYSFYQPPSNINTSSSYIKDTKTILTNDYTQLAQAKPYINSPKESTLKVAKTNRFLQQFNQQHESLCKKVEQELQSNEQIPNAAPEVLKKRRVAANARERRRMNNLNFAFDR